ncbi:hypothetical protein EVAR_89779_1 [Eumeta japonica]|uniref:Uncharacterized protein n=1 Tax=Eumeta variegata TaxID=151549 RepID=A0A4C1XD41_EUMVA|nr:hypothetical protein EVAR_89779_1 [Eumeta japonica]
MFASEQVLHLAKQEDKLQRDIGIKIFTLLRERENPRQKTIDTSTSEAESERRSREIRGKPSWIVGGRGDKHAHTSSARGRRWAPAAVPYSLPPRKGNYIGILGRAVGGSSARRSTRRRPTVAYTIISRLGGGDVS